MMQDSFELFLQYFVYHNKFSLGLKKAKHVVPLLTEKKLALISTVQKQTSTPPDLHEQ